MTDLAELKQLALRATPGNWRRKNRNWEADIDFVIAANPTAILALIERVERTEKALEDVLESAIIIPISNPKSGVENGKKLISVRSGVRTALNHLRGEDPPHIAAKKARAALQREERK